MRYTIVTILKRFYFQGRHSLGSSATADIPKSKNNYIGDSVEFFKYALMKDNLLYIGFLISFGLTSGIIIARGLYLGWRLDDIVKSNDAMRADISSMRTDMRADISLMNDKLDRHLSFIMEFTLLKNLPKDLADQLKEDEKKKE